MTAKGGFISPLSLASSLDEKDLEKLGLNRNEAKVYFGLILKGQATAAELVKKTGLHRNIVYDNLEKLIDKGLASFISENDRKKFFAEDPNTLLEFLESKKKSIDKEAAVARGLLPQIKGLLASSKEPQEAVIFRGIKGVKTVLDDLLESKEYWILGVSNASVELFGEDYWRNFNARRKSKKVKEHLLVNGDFRNTVGIKENALSSSRRLPGELVQVTEIMVFNHSVAIIVYSKQPIGIVLKDKNLFETFKKQFDYFWKLSEKNKL